MTASRSPGRTAPPWRGSAGTRTLRRKGPPDRDLRELTREPETFLDREARADGIEPVGVLDPTLPSQKARTRVARCRD